jgi:hypothetical protein
MTVDHEDDDSDSSFDPQKFLDDDILGIGSLTRKPPPTKPTVPAAQPVPVVPVVPPSKEHTFTSTSYSNRYSDDLELDDYEKEHLLSDMGVDV